ncbi:ABC transporter permease [Candidatus Saccharibacteria bacterium]|nr:ABC transporter permease [Candidatus Saccharibacteria bacterium]MBR2659637.1 ABC transporter permease [Candidatus Saccharibacteria bacterium]
MPILLRTHYKLALDSLRRNRTRSLLTCLGIAIGVASIILILSLTGSINRLIENQVKSAGADLIVIRPTTHESQIQGIVTELMSSSQYTQSSLLLKDLDTIKKNENVASVAPLAVSVNTATGDFTVDSTQIVGTTPDLQSILNFSMDTGSFLTDNFTQTAVVIGHQLAMDLFGTDIAVGKTFSSLGEKFMVVGVLNTVDDPINFNNINFDNAALLNVSQLSQLEHNIQIQQINIKVKNTNTIAETATQIKESLKESKSGETNFSVAYGDQITHPAGSLLNIISGMLTLVAGISLLVGGIGVMNIMLVSVAERTHEIGIRKSVGAANLNIFLQFLFESLVLSILGGILGLALGYAGAFGISLITPFTPYIDYQILLIALAISVGVGTLFGLYPALKAARKNPIDSLRQFR